MDLAPGGDEQESLFRDLCWQLIAIELMTDEELGVDGKRRPDAEWRSVAELKNDPGLKHDSYLTSSLEEGAVDPSPRRRKQTLHDYLVDQLVAEFATLSQRAALNLTDATVASWIIKIAAGSAPNVLNKLSSQARAVALNQLWADLDNESSPRHEAAKARLRLHAREHLERSSFRYPSSPTAAFRTLLGRYEQLGMTADDLHDAFWNRRIWPRIVSGANPLEDPVKLHAILQGRANSFVTDENDRIVKILALQSNLPATDRKVVSAPTETLDPVEREEILRRILSRMSENPQRKRSKPLINLLRTLPGEFLPRILESMARIPQREGPALLVVLLDAFPVEPPEGEETGWGKNQKAVAILEAWRNKPENLDDYLRSLNIIGEQLLRTRRLILEGFETARNPIDENRVAQLKSRFLADLWQDLVGNEDHPPSQGPDGPGALDVRPSMTAIAGLEGSGTIEQ